MSAIDCLPVAAANFPYSFTASFMRERASSAVLRCATLVTCCSIGFVSSGICHAAPPPIRNIAVKNAMSMLIPRVGGDRGRLADDRRFVIRDGLPLRGRGERLRAELQRDQFPDGGARAGIDPVEDRPELRRGGLRLRIRPHERDEIPRGRAIRSTHEA